MAGHRNACGVLLGQPGGLQLADDAAKPGGQARQAAGGLARVGQAAGVMNGVSQFASAFIPTIMGAIVGTATAAGNWYGALVTLAGVGLVGAILMLILTVKRV